MTQFRGHRKPKICTWQLHLFFFDRIVRKKSPSQYKSIHIHHICNNSTNLSNFIYCSCLPYNKSNLVFLNCKCIWKCIFQQTCILISQPYRFSLWWDDILNMFPFLHQFCVTSHTQIKIYSITLVQDKQIYLSNIISDKKLPQKLLLFLTVFLAVILLFPVMFCKA